MKLLLNVNRLARTNILGTAFSIYCQQSDADIISAVARCCYIALFVAILGVAQEPASAGREVVIDVLDRGSNRQIQQVVPGDFQVELEHRLVKVISAKRVRMHTRVAIVVGTGAGMATHSEVWDCAFLMANDLIQQLQSSSSISLFFSGKTTIRKIPSNVSEEIRSSGIKAAYEGTLPDLRLGTSDLARAISTALTSEQLARGDAVIIVPGPGHSNLTIDKALLEDIKSKGVRLYAIAIVGAAPTSPQDKYSPVELDNYVTSIGGRFWIVDQRDRGHFSEIATTVAAMVTQPCIVRLDIADADSGKLVVRYRSSKYPGAQVFAPKELWGIGSAVGN